MSNIFPIKKAKAIKYIFEPATYIIVYYISNYVYYIYTNSLFKQLLQWLALLAIFNMVI